jgi:CRISPR-associated protein Cmr1
MHELVYQVSFNTPAFLGNAEQQAQWRTPPFKALLRQWWRVVKARELGYSVEALRRAEGQVFGTAADEGPSKSLQSKVRIRLEPRADDGNKVQAWEAGSLKQWPSEEPKEPHPEVGRPVGTDLYMGYGPLDYDKATRQAKLGTSKSSGKQRTAINDTVKMMLRMRLPEGLKSEIEAAMQLAAWFGTLGSRSRNAWGSLHVEARGGAALVPLTAAALDAYTREFRDSLRLDWPSAIGRDARGPFVWRTPERSTWREVMKDLARTKIAFRTIAAPFPDAQPGSLEPRHLIAYPVTNHVVQLDGWKQNGRLPNQLRFKLTRTSGNRLQGVLVHLPCRLPEPLAKGARGRLPDEGALWGAVHRVLDDPKHQLTRLA